jgi:hypothetical protein
MNRDDDFHSYRNILTIDPGYSYENGTGFAIFDGNTHRLKACGLIRPSIPHLEKHASTIEIADEVRKKWEEEVGVSFDPKIICIEHPLAYFIHNGIRVTSQSVIMLAILSTRIEERFSAETVLRPYPHIWKKQGSEEETRTLVLKALGQWSLTALKEGLSKVPPDLHHNIFDAVALGLWAINLDEADQNNL